MSETDRSTSGGSGGRGPGSSRAGESTADTPGDGEGAAEAGERPAPLHDLRVLSIAQFGAGPFGTTLLADLGAEVIKIENPATGGDVARYVPPTDVEGDSLYFQGFNRGKKSVAIDLREPGGRDAFEELVRVSDGLYYNLRGDLPERLGLTYDDLKHLNPALVTCSLSGFGTDGPRAGQPGYDALVQGLAGYLSMTGEPGAPPTKCGVSVVDFASGYSSVLGLVAGLLQARTTGRGRDVDVSLMDTAVSMLSYFASWHLNLGWEPERMPGSGHQSLVPARIFPTDDGWISVFCAKETFWRRLARGLGREDLLQDGRFDTFADRREHREELEAILEEAFSRKSTEEWLEVLEGEVPVAPVNTLSEALREEQVRDRGMILEVEHPEFGTMRQVAHPVKTEGVPARPEAAPELGGDTDRVLGDLCGFTEERIAELRESGAVR